MSRQQRKLRIEDPSIFLSYAKKDKNKVRKIYNKLLDEKLNPWVDFEDLLPGEDWEQIILSTIRKARLVLVFLSKNSVSKRGYVQKEITEALDMADRMPEGYIYLIPVKLEECQVPSRLAKWHWVELNEETGLEKLVNSIRSNIFKAAERGKSKKKKSNKNIDEKPTPEEIIVNKILARGTFSYCRLKKGKVAICDKAFMEIRPTLPRIFSRLHREIPNKFRLTKQMVHGVIPSSSEYHHEEFLVTKIRNHRKYKYCKIMETSTGKKCHVDNDYLSYIASRYSNTVIYAMGTLLPVVIESHGRLVSIIMPMRDD